MMGAAGLGTALGFRKAQTRAGAGTAFASAESSAGPGKPNAVDPNVAKKGQKTRFPQVPRRKLGKTGVRVPCLSLGTNRLDNQIILMSALRWGVSYWDTANSYVGGNSELTIGKFLLKNPEVRKELFIVSKASGARKPEDVEKRLQTSLERMNTKSIDLYCFHGLSNPAQLTDELKRWVKSAKKRKLIRFFGFSTHKNTAKCLTAAAKLGWIDAIMTSYNFRLMQKPEMQDALDACYKAGIGLIAMKTLGLRLGHKVETEEDKKLVSHFLQKGFTEQQAKIKVVLEDKRISSACVGMQTVDILDSNALAVLDKTKLSQADKELFRQYAADTCTGYCAGCSEICDEILPDTPYVADIMRYLMYYNSYGRKQHARQLFARIPGRVKSRLLAIDYSSAEACCPQHLPIAKLVAEAVSKLARTILQTHSRRLF